MKKYYLISGIFISVQALGQNKPTPKKPNSDNVAFFKTTNGTPGTFIISNSNNGNGFCFGGTAIRIKQNFLYLKCFNYNNESQIKTTTFVKSSIGWHEKYQVCFKDSGKCYKLTEPEPGLYHKRDFVGDKIDVNSKEFYDLKKTVTPNDFKEEIVDGGDKDFINPVVKENAT